MQIKSSKNTGPQSQGTEMSAPSLHLSETGQSISYAEGSPVRTSATSDAGKGSMDQEAGCSLKSFAWLDNSDPDSFCWRTYQPSLLEAWEPYSENWTRSGMMQSGIAFPLPTWARHIKEIVSLYWPTPAARDYKDTPGMARESVNPDGSVRKRADQLARRVYVEENTPPRGGTLNPTWVEWLMGFPEGWTDLSASEMPLFPRSQNSSEENSSDEYRRQ